MKSIQWAIQTNDFPGAEYDPWGPRTLGYVDANTGIEALQQAQAAFPDAHITQLISKYEVFDNPNPAQRFAPWSWRDAADSFIEEQAIREANTPHQNDAIDVALNVGLGITDGIAWLFGFRR